MDRTFLCYAHGRDGAWEAICVDLDIAVCGESRREVVDLLEEAAKSYIEDALREEPAVAQQLLHRRAPWHVRFELWARWQFWMLTRAFQQEQQASFGLACPA